MEREVRQGVDEGRHGAGVGRGRGKAAVAVVGGEGRGRGRVVILRRRIGLYGHAGGLGGGNMRERGVMDEGLQKGGGGESKCSPFSAAEAADDFGEGDQSRAGTEVGMISQ